MPESELQPLVQKYIGAGRTFEDLQAAADAVSDYLRRKGYFVAQAFLPDQKIEGGAIEIAVLEGRLGEVRLDIGERALFLASDLRGIVVRSVVEPGPTPGTANLVVQVAPGKRIDGTIEFDNFGSRAMRV